MVGRSSAATFNSLCLMAQRMGSLDGKAVKNSELKTLQIIAYSSFKHSPEMVALQHYSLGSKLMGTCGPY